MGSVADFVQRHFFDPSLDGWGGYLCGFSIVTNQSTRVVGYFAPATYGENLRFEKRDGKRMRTTHSSWGQYDTPTYYSDRTWDDPNTADREEFPFSPRNTDKTKVELEVGPDRSLDVRLYAMSWGGALNRVRPIGYEAGVLYGVGAGIGAHVPEALYAISLGEPFVQIT